jgi:hypothetical protein
MFCPNLWEGGRKLFKFLCELRKRLVKLFNRNSYFKYKHSMSRVFRACTKPNDL